MPGKHAQAVLPIGKVPGDLRDSIDADFGVRDHL